MLPVRGIAPPCIFVSFLGRSLTNQPLAIKSGSPGADPKTGCFDSLIPLRPSVVQTTGIEQTPPPIGGHEESQSKRLERAIETVGNLLPVSGPITAFAWLNTLQGFEELPFEEAVKRAGRLFGCHPYLTEDRYRDKFVRGRIRRQDLVAVLAKDLGEGAGVSIHSLATRLELRLAMLEYPLRSRPARRTALVCGRDRRAHPVARRCAARECGNALSPKHGIGSCAICAWAAKWSDASIAFPRDHRIQHLLADLIRHFGESAIENWGDNVWETLSLQALWRICREGVHATESVLPAPAFAVRHRDLLLEATGEDSDQLVHDVLIRFCAAFTDQGFAHWALPNRDAGFFLRVQRNLSAAGRPSATLAGGPSGRTGATRSRSDRADRIDSRIAGIAGRSPRPSGTIFSRRRSWRCVAGPA